MSRYDYTSTEYIMKFIKARKWDSALRLLIPYCQKYPQDGGARILLIHTLLNLGCLDAARIVIETTNINKNFVDRTKNSLYYAKVKLLILEKKYRECLDFIMDNENFFRNEDEIYYVRAFCKKRLNEHTYPADFNNYTYKQILNYSKEELMAGLARNCFQFDETESSFQEDFSLEKLYDIVKVHINDAPRTYRGLYFYELYFKCDNCGIVNGKRANYVYVTVFNDSEDIAFMYPTLNEENASYIDINEYFIQETSKRRRLSQIEKFNKRYQKHINSL